MIAAIYARKSTDPGGVGEESSVDFKPYVDFFAVLLTPTFGITTAWIAIQQYRLAKEWMKRDLYEKRLLVYRGLVDVTGVVLAASTQLSEGNLPVGEPTREVGDQASRARVVGRSAARGTAKAIREASTRAVFDRYHIVSPADLQEATRKLAGTIPGTINPGALKSSVQAFDIPQIGG